MTRDLDVQGPDGSGVDAPLRLVEAQGLNGATAAVMRRLDQVEAVMAGLPSGAPGRRPVWPLIATAIGAAVVGALAGYMAGGFVCKVKGAFRP